MSFLNPFGSHKSSNKTEQTDSRSVTDYSGANVGSTINIYGADAAGLMSKFNLGGNQAASPYGSNADANGIRSEGLAGGASSLMSNPIALGALALGLVAVLTLAKR